MIRFLEPVWLLALLPVLLVAGVYVWRQFRRRQYAMRFTNVDLLRTLAQRVATEGHVGVDFVDLDGEGNRMDRIDACQPPVGGGEQGLAQRLALFLRAAAAQAGHDMHKTVGRVTVADTEMCTRYGAGANSNKFRHFGVNCRLMQVVYQRLHVEAVLQIDRIFGNDMRHLVPRR